MQQAHSEALQRAARQAIPSAAASGGGGGVEKEGPLSQGEALTMRMHAERAEARAEAAHSELREFSKKSAREIAQLKVLLAERDAQLMGTGGGRGSYGSYGRGGAEGAFDGPYDTLLPRQQPQLQGGGGYGMVSPRPAPQVRVPPCLATTTCEEATLASRFLFLKLRSNRGSERASLRLFLLSGRIWGRGEAASRQSGPTSTGPVPSDGIRPRSSLSGSPSSTRRTAVGGVGPGIR